MKYKRKVDNKMRWSGDIDDKKGIIRINKSKGDVLDTIVHEETHRKHPKMHEKTVREETRRLISKLTPKQKSLYYNLYK